MAETDEFGRLLGRLSEAGDVILLFGDLGAGKTTLTQSIAAGLDVPTDDYVTSPSFSLMNKHNGRIPLYHMDCYRLEGEDDVEGSGLMDYIVADGLTVVEWPERLGSLTPEDRLDITITLVDGARELTLEPHGSAWKGRMDRFAAAVEKNNARQEKI